MVNHGRNLLLNISGASSPNPDFPGEQYVPTDFTPRVLPESLMSCWRALFGASPDRAALNWRLQELLTCIHACDLDDYLTTLDSRITYWPFNSSLMQAYLAGPTATQVLGATQNLQIIGNRSAIATSDRLYFNWQLNVLNTTNVVINSLNDNGMSVTTPYNYTISSGLSSPVPLPSSSLSVIFSSVVNTRWQLTWLNKPRRSLVDVMNEVDSAIGGSISDVLFADGDPEPYQTFGNLWRNNEQVPYRLSGVVLALIYRINELRVG